MSRHLGAARAATLIGIIACHSNPGATKPAPAVLDSLHWFSAGSSWLPRTNVHRPGLRIDLQVARTMVTAGDSLELVAVARNSTPVAIQVGRSCGPAMDVRITAPSGQTASALQLRAPDPSFVVFTCELGPYHFAQANDSLVNRYWWRAPALPGRYVAVAGARFSEGLADESAPVAIIVREP